MTDRELCEKAAERLGLRWRMSVGEGFDVLDIEFKSPDGEGEWVAFPKDGWMLHLQLAFVGRVAEAMDAVVGMAPPVRGHTDYEVCIHADAPMHGTDKNPARAALKAVIE